MALTTTEDRHGAPPAGYLAGMFLGMLFLISILGVVLGILASARNALVDWWQEGVSLTGFVTHVLVEWPQSWQWPAALAWLKPTAGAIEPLTLVLSWSLVIFAFMLPMVTYQIYALRKIMGFMQARVGPTQVGPHGLLQTPADVIKLLTKEDIIPAKADRPVFMIAPFLVLVPASMAYLVIPFGNRSYTADGALRYSLVVGDLNIGVLFLAAISSVAVIGIISAGWASNNKYALLGSMRSAAQLVTYEIPLSLALVAPVIWCGSLNLSDIVLQQNNILQWTVWPCLFAAIVFAISALAELSHVPFDLSEAESELISGYNTEYSGMKFAMFFLAEFSNAFILSALAVTLLFGGWQSPFPETWPLLGWDFGLFAMFWFFTKTFCLMFFLFWLRATLPRLRIDQLMAFGWKFLIPVGVINVFLVAVLKVWLG